MIFAFLGNRFSMLNFSPRSPISLWTHTNSDVQSWEDDITDNTYKSTSGHAKIILLVFASNSFILMKINSKQ